MVRKASSAKGNKLMEAWSSAGYDVNRIAWYKAGGTTVALRTVIQTTRVESVTSSPSKLASSQNLYVFLQEEIGELGALFFYDRKRLNKLKKECQIASERIESMPGYLQEDSDLLVFHDAYCQAYTYFQQAFANVRKDELFSAYTSLRKAINQSERMISSDHVTSVRMTGYIQEEFKFLKQALEGLS